MYQVYWRAPKMPTEEQAGTFARLTADGVPSLVTFYGPPGNGKTRIATYVFADVYAGLIRSYDPTESLAFPPQALWITGRQFFQRMKAYDREGFDWQREMAELCRAQLRVLMIDDAIPETVTPTDSGNLTELIERRRTSNLVTIITTNSDPAAVEAKCSGRLADRLFEGAIFRYAGRSFRRHA
jgi:DNA replication protein DnaC